MKMQFWSADDIEAAFGAALNPSRILRDALFAMQNSPMRKFQGWEADRAAVTLVNAIRHVENERSTPLMMVRGDGPNRREATGDTQKTQRRKAVWVTRRILRDHLLPRRPSPPSRKPGSTAQVGHHRPSTAVVTPLTTWLMGISRNSRREALVGRPKT